MPMLLLPGSREDFPLPSFLRWLSQTGFELFARKCCSPIHTSVCTPWVHSFGFMKCRYSHQQNVHTLPALLILIRTKETGCRLRYPEKALFKHLSIAHLVHTKCYNLHLPLQCSIWECTFTYYLIGSNKHKFGVKIMSLWQSSNLYGRRTILQTHLHSQPSKND